MSIYINMASYLFNPFGKPTDTYPKSAGKSLNPPKRPPRLTREVSGFVSAQYNGDCWNYASCRVVLRLISNVLDWKGETDEQSCNEIYTSLENFNFEYAKTACTGGMNYAKVLMYFFLFCLGHSRFSYCVDSGGTVTSDKNIGTKSVESLQFFSDDLLNNPKFRTNVHVTNILGHGLVFQETYTEFEQVLFPLIDEFQKKTKRSNEVKSLSYLSYEDDHGIDIDQLKRVLDMGLYIAGSISMGDSTYADQLQTFNKENALMRPVAGKIDSTMEGRHAIAIVKYLVSPTTNQITFVAKNTWGSGWGVDGLFYIGQSEIRPLEMSFSWIQPKKLPKSQSTSPEITDAGESENVIYEGDYYTRKSHIEEFFGIIFPNQERITIIKFVAFLRAIRHYTQSANQFTSSIQFINDSQDISYVDIDKLAEKLSVNLTLRYEMPFNNEFNSIIDGKGDDLTKTAESIKTKIDSLVKGTISCIVYRRDTRSDGGYTFFEEMPMYNFQSMNKHLFGDIYFELFGEQLSDHKITEIFTEVNGDVKPTVLDGKKLIKILHPGSKIKSIELQKFADKMATSTGGRRTRSRRHSAHATTKRRR